MMDTLDESLSSLVRFGVSEQLIQNLQAIEETQAATGDHQGRPLYDQSAIYEMRCSILCHNYSKTIWEYSHFIAILEYLSERGVIDLFWAKEIVTGSRLRNWLANFNKLDWIDVGAKGSIKVQFDGREFALSPRRINLMAAWTAFLAIVDPSLIMKVSQFKQGLTKQSVDDFAKDLKSKLDQYLAPHLQAIHQQRQGRLLLTWLKEYSQNEKLLTDESIIEFWLANAEIDGGDFKRFVTVAECGFRLQRAIQLGESQRSVDSAQSYHQDNQGNDSSWQIDLASNIMDSNDYIDDDHSFDTDLDEHGYDSESAHSQVNSEIEALSEGDSIFSALMSSPEVTASEQLADEPLNDIKFLTAKDLEFCIKLEEAGDGLYELPKTFIRAQIFGTQQARMTEDLRKTKGANIGVLMQCEDTESYEPWAEDLNQRVEKIKQTRDAITYILFLHQQPEALVKLIEGLSPEEQAILMKELSKYSELPKPEALAELINDLFPKLVKQKESVFNKVNREGFKAIPSRKELPHYIKGDQCLSGLQLVFAEYYDALQKEATKAGNFQAIELTDKATFSKQFSALYSNKGVMA